MQVTPTLPTPHSEAILREKASQLEATFLSEMLSYTGIDKQSTAFSGGHGEEQFASYLRQEHAKAIVTAGGLGLSEHLFNALSQRSSHAD